MFATASNTIRLQSNGLLVNPGTDVLATTGAQPAGRYEVIVTLTATVGISVSTEHRNAADNATVEAAVTLVPGNTTRQPRFAFVLEANERVRVILNAGITGTASGTINWRRIS